MESSNRLKTIVIASKDNAKIKTLRLLRQKKYRDENGKFLVENAIIIRDAAKAGVVFDAIFVTKNFIENDKEMFNLIVHNTKSSKCYLIDEKINKSFSSLDTAPGIAAVYFKPKSKIDFTGPIIYLNAINNPGNVGAILRSALAFGLKNIVIDEHSADVYNPKTISAAKDTIFKLNVEFDKNREFLINLKKMSIQGGSASSWPIFATRLEMSMGLDILKKQKLFCVILGSESHGVDKEIQEISDDFIRIPISEEIESLNVAASAAIIFYEIYSHSQQYGEKPYN